MFTEIITKEIRDKRLKSIKNFTVRNYVKFINTFIDKPNFAKYKGSERKSFERINLLLNNNIFKPKELGKLNIGSRLISQHLFGFKSDYIYYCNRPFTQYPLVCIDLDDLETTTEEDLTKVVDYLISIFPPNSLYFEKSTHGKGLHIYFFIDFSYLLNREVIETLSLDVSLINTAENKNSIIKKLSDILSSYINPNYNVKFDAIKSTVSDYQLNESGIYNIINSGVLCKLPIPDTKEKFLKLKNLTPIDIKRVIDTTTNNNTLIYLVSVNNEININNKGTRESLLLQKNNIEANVKAENGTKIEDDAMQRSLKHGAKLFREIYKKENRTPNLEEYRTKYRKEVGTGKETTDDIKRLQHCYNYIVKTFDPTIIHTKKKDKLYLVGEYLNILKTITSKELINRWIQDNYRCTDRIDIRDLDIGLGYYYVKITMSQTSKDPNLINSIPYREVIKFADAAGYPRKISTKKAQMIKKYLIKLDLIEEIDESYVPGYRGKKFRMTNKFYELFKKEALPYLLNCA